MPTYRPHQCRGLSNMGQEEEEEEEEEEEQQQQQQQQQTQPTDLP